MKNKKFTKFTALLLSLLVVFSLAGCGGSKSSASPAQFGGATNNFAAEEAFDGGYDYAPAAEAEAPAYNESESGVASSPKSDQTVEAATTQEKLVYTCNMSIETTKYEEALKTIQQKISEYNGIIERQEEYDEAYNWYYSDYNKTNGTLTSNIIVRIPSAKYFDFINSFDGIGKVKSKSSQVENITKSYNDTKAAIEGYEKQQERLLEMMDKAETIEEMVIIEDRLTEVEVTLNTYRSRLATMDTDVAYSTVSIQLREVIEYSPDTPPVKQSTFIDRLKNTLTDTWQFFLDLLEGILFTVIRLIPILVVLGVLAAIIVPIIKKSRKNKPKKEKFKKPTNDNKPFVINKPENTDEEKK